MPPPLLRTHMIRSILQNVLSQGQSQRRCAQALGISKGVVAKYVAAAQAAGLDWPAIEPLAEHLGRRTLQYSQFCVSVR